MVGYGKNMSHRHNNARQRPSPYCRKQLTCRLCGRVMLTTQAMIAHIEMHLAQEEALRARPNQQFPPINQPPNLLNNIPPRPNNNIIVPNPSIRPNFPPPPPIPFFGNVSTQISTISRPPNVLPPQVSPPAIAQAQQSVMAVTHDDDVCRPFLRLLERPIPNVVGFVDLDEENDGDKLDLTLKL